MSTGPAGTGEQVPPCAVCGLPARGACRLCGRAFCPAHGSLRRLLCRRHSWLTLAVYVGAAVIGAAVWWLFFRER
jgi:hypothetical protein